MPNEFVSYELLSAICVFSEYSVESSSVGMLSMLGFDGYHKYVEPEVVWRQHGQQLILG